jgi:formyltetrahydrofolate synthetase
MDFNNLLTPDHFEEIARQAECKTSEIKVFAIPDSLAINSWLTSTTEAAEMYKKYADEAGKPINNANSWDEFEGYGNRLILFPGGYGIWNTPFKKASQNRT